MPPSDTNIPPTPGAPIIKKRPLSDSDKENNTATQIEADNSSAEGAGEDTQSPLETTQHTGDLAPTEQHPEPADTNTVDSGSIPTVQEKGTPDTVNAQHSPDEVDSQALAEKFAQSRERHSGEPFHFPTPEEAFGTPHDENAEGTDANAITLPPTQAPAATQATDRRPSLNEASQHLRAAQGNIEALALQIKNGEYGINGAGDAGRIWRAIQAAPAEEAVDIWGELIATGTALWSHSYSGESITLIERSVHDFGVPDIWKERVETSLKTAHDYRATLAAEEAFEAGRDEEAMERANEISEQLEGSEYRTTLSQRSKRRTKNRRLVFISAGVTIAGLIVASVIAITTMERIDLTPPAPDFSGVGASIEAVSDDLREQRELRDQAQAATTPAVDEPADTTSPLEAALSQPSGTNPTVLASTAPLDTPVTQTPTPVAPQTPATAETTLPDTIGTTTPAPTQPEASPQSTAVPTEPQAAPQPTATPTEPQATDTATTAPDAELTSSCVLGYAVMAQAQDAAQGRGPEVAQRLAEFSSAVDTACSPLNISATDMARGMATVDAKSVADMAENILSGEQ